MIESDEPEIGDVHEGIVEGSEDAGNAKNELTCNHNMSVIALRTVH
jgi:hypothetical protein